MNWLSSSQLFLFLLCLCGLQGAVSGCTTQTREYTGVKRDAITADSSSDVVSSGETTDQPYPLDLVVDAIRYEIENDWEDPFERVLVSPGLTGQDLGDVVESLSDQGVSVELMTTDMECPKSKLEWSGKLIISLLSAEVEGADASVELHVTWGLRAGRGVRYEYQREKTGWIRTQRTITFRN